jgi:hypothetical protein|tara:strand:+ start:37 stop:420 length:384 start_codon:yes stop_codon:yes gene_type:complete
MRYLIYIVFLFSVLLGQTEEETITLPKTDVIEWANRLQGFEKADSLSTIAISDLESVVFKLEENAFMDSLIIEKRELQILLLKETNELYKDKVKLVKPKWHENKWLWFVYGVGATAISVNLAGQITN